MTVKKCTFGLGGPVISRYNYTQVNDKSLIVIIIIQGIINFIIKETSQNCLEQNLILIMEWANDLRYDIK